MADGALHELPFEDRTPYEVALAVVQEIVALAPHLKDEDAVWRAFGQWRGRQIEGYLQTVRRTHHSIFHYQLQHLYEFGLEQVPAQCREDFIFHAGFHFSERMLTENIFAVLQVAVAKPGSFEETVANMIRTYLYRYAANKYILNSRIEPEAVTLEIEDRAADQIREHLSQYGLSAERCFQNSFSFIAGGVTQFVSNVVRDCGSPHVRFHCAGQKGEIRIALAKPREFAYDRLLDRLMGFVQEVQMRQQEELEIDQLERGLVIDSITMQSTWERIRRASQTDELVLLLGESGTGKTFIAGRIHELSSRRSGPFIEIGLTSDIGSENMIQSNLFGHEKGSFTGATEQKKGLFSLAHGGTIFLDEIGDASSELQAKLLRVVETGRFRRLGGVTDVQVDVRIIAATHRDLEERVRTGQFRQDLYYRLHVIPIQIPPLRERPEAIPALVAYFLGRIAHSSRTRPRMLAPDAMEHLVRYPFPGNIRELQHALKHAVAMTDRESLELAAFPESIRCFAGAAELSSSPQPAPPACSAVVDRCCLQGVLRAADPLLISRSERKWMFPSHIDHARREYLSALIEEFGGELGLISQFWDRGSDKTLRAHVQALGLEEQLAAARRHAKLGKA